MIHKKCQTLFSLKKKWISKFVCHSHNLTLGLKFLQITVLNIQPSKLLIVLNLKLKQVHLPIGLDKSGNLVNIFLISPLKHMLPRMSIHNICFLGEIRKKSILGSMCLNSADWVANSVLHLNIPILLPMYQLCIQILIVLEFNDMSTLVGHFVSSPREREKRDRRDSRGDENEW